MPDVCTSTSARPMNVLHRPRVGDAVLDAISKRLSPNIHPLSDSEHPSALIAAKLDSACTSVDLIGHTTNGAIEVGKWTLSTSISDYDQQEFKRIGAAMRRRGVFQMRLLACGSLRLTTLSGLVDLEDALNDGRSAGGSAIRVYGSQISLDENCYDEVNHRFADGAACSLLRRAETLMQIAVTAATAGFR